MVGPELICNTIGFEDPFKKKKKKNSLVHVYVLIKVENPEKNILT